MPLQKILYPNRNTQIGFWKITEEVEELLNLLPLSMAHHPGFTDITHAKRQREWLATRCLVQELLPDADWDIAYNEYGRPYFEDDSAQLSISHIDDWCAVILHPEKNVAVDLEVLANRLERLKTKFATDTELNQWGEGLHGLALIWSAKETMYKYYGKRGIDFKRDMEVINIDGVSEGEIRIRFRSDEVYTIVFRYFEENAVVTYMIE